MNLNPAQYGAVHLDYSNIVVMSGPGSGKTLVATERVQRLMGKIVVLTYTNAAAEEFNNRLAVQTTVGKVRLLPEFCGTLHSYCYRLIRRHGHLLGYPKTGVTILPESERKKLLNEIRRDHGYDKVMSDKELEERRSARAVQIWAEYAFRIKRNAVVDFDRILTEGAILLSYPTVREAMTIDHLVVDEAQDSAWIDWQIFEAIPTENYFFIGDIDQAIFEFRGATPKRFLDIAQQNVTNVLKLEANYRCSKEVCRCANKLIQHNKFRYDKATVSVTGIEGWVRFQNYDNEQEELDGLTAQLNRWPNCERAVLCRTNRVAASVIGHLYGRIKTFYEVPPARPYDWTLALLLIGLLISPHNELLAEQYLKLTHGDELVKQMKTRDQAENKHLSERVTLRDKDTQIGRYLVANGVSIETMRKIEHVANSMPGDGYTLSDLLHELRSDEEPTYRVPRDAVYIGTMHSAKGREFDYVFLPAFEDAPFMDDNVEEERRLVYVALTRARTGVWISWADTRRMQYGEAQPRKPSRFLPELELGFSEIDNLSGLNPNDL